jgi:hypothetical protein
MNRDRLTGIPTITLCDEEIATPGFQSMDTGDRGYRYRCRIMEWTKRPMNQERRTDTAYCVDVT